MSRTYHRDGDPARLGQFFVFGSNTAGHHYGGAARAAHELYGAEWGVHEGRTGQCYAIPTMDLAASAALLLDDIRASVEAFIEYAFAHPDKLFFVTRIGCGIAGHRDADIAPMFHAAPENCSFPDTWACYLQDDSSEGIVDLMQSMKANADAIQSSDLDRLREHQLNGYYSMLGTGRRPW